MGLANGYLKADLEKYYIIEIGSSNPGILSKLRLFIVHFGLHCVIVYRYGQFAKPIFRRNRFIGFPFMVIYFPLNFFCKMIHHVDIGDATIGPGFYISHAGTILIGPITIGSNLSITHNVTIGVGHRHEMAGIPRSIGDNVWIGTGSVISGDIVIGSDVTITSGSIISRDIPSGCLAGGNPGRVILREYNNRYLLGRKEQHVNTGDLPEHRLNP